MLATYGVRALGEGDVERVINEVLEESSGLDKNYLGTWRTTVRKGAGLFSDAEKFKAYVGTVYDAFCRRKEYDDIKPEVPVYRTKLRRARLLKDYPFWKKKTNKALDTYVLEHPRLVRDGRTALSNKHSGLWRVLQERGILDRRFPVYRGRPDKK